MEHEYYSYEEVPVEGFLVKDEEARALDNWSGIPSNPVFDEPFDTKFHTTFGNLDEGQMLSLSSPEPEIEELLFPDLRAHTGPDLASPPTEQKTEPMELIARDGLEVNLCHKPRGCKGIWQPVANRSALRVTKGKGKWLKLEIKSAVHFRPSDVEVFLLDVGGAVPAELVRRSEDGFVVESVLEASSSSPHGMCCVDAEVKLDRVCKKLQFWVTVKTTAGVLRGKSVEFAAHNNGKANKKENSDEGQSPPVDSYDSNSSPTEGKQIVVPPLGNLPAERAPQKKRKTTVDPPATFVEEPEAPSSFIPGSLRVNGVVRAKAFLQFSDLRLKADIQELTDAVDIVSQLQGKSFVWKKGTPMEEEEGGKRVIGLIAQEVQRVVPNVVHEDENGVLSVAYAELVPILIQAFKEHNQQYGKDQEVLNKQIQDLSDKLEKTQLLLKKVEEETAELRKKPQLTFVAPQMVVRQVDTSEEPSGAFKRGALRTVAMVTFLAGIAVVIFGSILLGMTLTKSQAIDTTVMEAINLSANDVDGVPDPYCEVSVGKSLFRTDTVYNSPNPLWGETFSADYDSSLYNVVFEMYDRNQYSFADVKIGQVEYNVDNLDSDKRYEEWLPLDSFSGNSTSGQLKVALYISSKKRPGYELAILGVGVLLTMLSLGTGFYAWRTPSQKKEI